MTSKMDNESKQLISHYQNLQKSIEMAQGQKNMVYSNISSIENSIKEIEEITNHKNDNESIVHSMMPLGSGCFIEAEIKYPLSKILVNIGSGICIQKSNSETICYLNDKKEQMKKLIDNITKSVNNMTKEIYELELKINKLNNKIK